MKNMEITRKNSIFAGLNPHYLFYQVDGHYLNSKCFSLCQLE